jgi:hypothetical protein
MLVHPLPVQPLLTRNKTALAARSERRRSINESLVTMIIGLGVSHITATIQEQQQCPPKFIAQRLEPHLDSFPYMAGTPHALLHLVL